MTFFITFFLDRHTKEEPTQSSIYLLTYWHFYYTPGQGKVAAKAFGPMNAPKVEGLGEKGRG